MSKANPRKAVRALLPESKSGDGWTVRPLSLATYAILERIKSPLLGVVRADGVLSLVPSLYVLTHDPLDSLSGDLFGKSVKWADSLPPAALVAIHDACNAQVRAIIDVVPEFPQDDSKKRTQRMARLPCRMGLQDLRLVVARSRLRDPGERPRALLAAAPRSRRSRRRLPALGDRGD